MTWRPVETVHVSEPVHCIRDTRGSTYRFAIEDQHKGTCDMSKGRYRSHSLDKDPVGPFMCPRKQPVITDAEGKLEACNANLIEWSSGKIDLAQRSEQIVISSEEMDVIPSSMSPSSPLDAIVGADRGRTSFLQSEPFQR